MFVKVAHTVTSHSLAFSPVGCGSATVSVAPVVVVPVTFDVSDVVVVVVVAVVVVFESCEDCSEFCRA